MTNTADTTSTKTSRRSASAADKRRPQVLASIEVTTTGELRLPPELLRRWRAADGDTVALRTKRTNSTC